MRDFDSIEILNTLLDGLDPVTGEVLENDHVCCTGEVMSALYEAVQALEEKKQEIEHHEKKKLENRKTKINREERREWSEDECRHLKALNLRGAGLEELCQRLWRKPREVREQIKKLGLHCDCEEQETENIEKSQKSVVAGNENAGKGWTRQEDNRLIEAWHEGMRITEIAQELKRTPNAIRSRLKKNGLLETAPDIAPWTEEDTRQLFRMVDRKCTLKEMAEHFGRTEKAMEARLFYLGLSKKAPKLFD